MTLGLLLLVIPQDGGAGSGRAEGQLSVLQPVGREEVGRAAQLGARLQGRGQRGGPEGGGGRVPVRPRGE
eukprot:1195450-Prorocentrum_minimum.AAC.4